MCFEEVERENGDRALECSRGVLHLEHEVLPRTEVRVLNDSPVVRAASYQAIHVAHTLSALLRLTKKFPNQLIPTGSWLP